MVQMKYNKIGAVALFISILCDILYPYAAVNQGSLITNIITICMFLI